jgi:predicted nucleic acid-binding protein
MAISLAPVLPESLAAQVCRLGERYGRARGRSSGGGAPGAGGSPPGPRLQPGGGHGAGANDLWIAALVLQHNLRLHDRDRHFDHLPQIVRV